MGGNKFQSTSLWVCLVFPSLSLTSSPGAFISPCYITGCGSMNVLLHHASQPSYSSGLTGPPRCCYNTCDQRDSWTSVLATQLTSVSDIEIFLIVSLLAWTISWWCSEHRRTWGLIILWSVVKSLEIRIK